MGLILPKGRRPFFSSCKIAEANKLGFLTPLTAPTAAKAPLLPRNIMGDVGSAHLRRLVDFPLHSHRIRHDHLR